MSVILAASIAIQLLALGAALVLLWRLGDWRIGLLAAMLALMAIGRIVSGPEAPTAQGLVFVMDHGEIAGVLASVLAALALLFFSQTILHRQRAEAALRSSEQRLRRAHRMAKLGNWELNLGSNYLHWSDGTYRIFGVPLEEGRVSRKRFYSLVHPDDRDFVGDTFRATVAGSTPYSIDHRIVLPDGEVRIVHQEAEVVLDETGRAIRMVGTVQDITERKTAEDALRAGEARLKAIIDNSPAVIGLKDVEGRYLTVNRTFEKICGVENGDIQGRTAYDIFEKDVADAFTALEQQVLKTGEPVEAEITVATVDGERIFMVVSFPVPPGPGTDDLPIATGLIATDITERKHVETELVAAKEQAELASRAKSDFLANMSHELRTPLNAIIGFSDIIQNETFGAVGNDKYVEYAKDINDSGAHLLELINDILDLSKVEAGKLELHEEDVDLGDAIRSCLTLVRDRAAIEGLALEGEVPEFLAKLRADERKIKQILLNLLSNAIKFTPRGGRVTVRASAEGDDVVIAVSDTGVGMTPEEIETAMTPFGQVTGHMDRTHEGTGLGLPLTKALIELHGGRLELTSEPGSGTTARITLPAAGIAGANTTAA